MSIAIRHCPSIYAPLRRGFPRLSFRALLATLQIGLALLLAGAALACILHCHLVRLTAPPTTSIGGVTLAICHGGAPTEGVPTINTLLFFSLRDAPLAVVLVPLLLHPPAPLTLASPPAPLRMGKAPPVPPPR